MSSAPLLNKHSLRHNSMVYLFILLVLFWLLIPFLQQTLLGYHYILQLSFFLLVLMGAFALSTDRTTFVIAIIFVGLLIVINLGEIIFQTNSLLFAHLIIEQLYLIYLTSMIIISVSYARKVTPDKVFGAMCAYLLIGVIWGMFYFIISACSTNAFSSNLINTHQELSTSHYQIILLNYIYYSFVTITTLGYGDIHPISAVARAFSSLEAVIGQLYIAVLISRLVGLQISQRVSIAIDKQKHSVDAGQTPSEASKN